MPAAERPPLRREAGIAAGAYAAYLAVGRLAVRRGEEVAMGNARRLHALERALRVDAEPVQRRLAHHGRLAGVAASGYGALNFGLAIGWLALLRRRGDPAFAPLRRATLVGFLGAQPVFLAAPTAPPRRLGGRVDPLPDSASEGLDEGLAARLGNPVAAMPSLHLVFATVTAAGWRRHGRSRWTRRLAPAYPPLVAGLVVATANHFVLDVVAGGLLGRLALRLAA